MNRKQLLGLLKEHKPTLEKRFGLTELSLLGSVARESVNEESDVYILVRFEGPASSRRYFGVQFYIEELLGRPVDLVTS